MWLNYFIIVTFIGKSIKTKCIQTSFFLLFPSCLSVWATTSLKPKKESNICPKNSLYLGRERGGGQESGPLCLSCQTSQQCRMYNLQWTALYNGHGLIYTLQFTQYHILCTVNNVHYSVHFPKWSEHCIILFLCSATFVQNLFQTETNMSRFPKVNYWPLLVEERWKPIEQYFCEGQATIICFNKDWESQFCQIGNFPGTHFNKCPIILWETEKVKNPIILQGTDREKRACVLSKAVWEKNP